MHRPTAASTTKPLLLASTCRLLALLVALLPIAARADEVEPVSPAAITPADQQSDLTVDQSSKLLAPSISPDDISDLVTKLGDDAYAARERATNQLVQKGIAARPQLLAALESSDAEIRFRAKRILSEVVEADFQRRLSAFSADVDGKLGLTMPGWTAFKEAVGEDRTARDLFVEIQQAEGPLLEAYEQGPKPAAEKLRTLLAQDPATFDRAVVIAGVKGRRTLVPQNRAASLGTILAWLFVAGDNEIAITDDITARVALLPQNQVFQQAAQANKQPDPRAQVCRKILARWIARDINPIFAPYNLSFAYTFNLKEGLPLAVDVLKRANPTSDPISRSRAILLVGKFGNKEHLTILEPLLKDSMVCFDTGGPNHRVQTQVRDIALAMSVKLAGQDPKKFGFDRWQSADVLPLNLNTLGFSTDDDKADGSRGASVPSEQRDTAFKKWQDWQAGQKSAAGDDAAEKPSDEKPG